MTPVTATASTSSVDLSTMDVNTAMLFVMIGHVDAIEDAIMEYLQKVQYENDQMALLNKATNLLNTIYGAFGSDQSKTYKDKYGTNNQPMYDANNALKDAQAVVFDASQKGPLSSAYNANDPTTYWLGGLKDTNTGYEIQQAITSLNNLVTEISNAQQIDMINLQSMSNQRDEVYNILTNWVKAVHDTDMKVTNNI